MTRWMISTRRFTRWKQTLKTGDARKRSLSDLIRLLQLRRNWKAIGRGRSTARWIDDVECQSLND